VKRLAALWPFLLLGTSTMPALAAQAQASPDSGATAWLLTSTALVLLMTLPGLALFHGGLVRSRNVLSVLMQCFALCCSVTRVSRAGERGARPRSARGERGYNL
jgi:ammonium transporter family